MPRRSAMLIGPGTGPKVRVGAAGRIKATRDTTFRLRRILGDGAEIESTHEASADGVLFGHCEFAQISYEGKNKNFIACVIIGD